MLVDGIVVCDGVTLVAARATCAVTAPALPGAHQITARYEPGSLDFSPRAVRSRSSSARAAPP